MKSQHLQNPNYQSKWYLFLVVCSHYFLRTCLFYVFSLLGEIPIPPSAAPGILCSSTCHRRFKQEWSHHPYLWKSLLYIDNISWYIIYTHLLHRLIRLEYSWDCSFYFLLSTNRDLQKDLMIRSLVTGGRPVVLSTMCFRIPLHFHY